ncbi:MAG: tRNA cytidylyltransferase [Nannocystis sp.]|nr:tRNA cytidylyltransferase [Nannocystis sp.]
MTLSDDAGLPRSANEAATLLADAALPAAILEVAQTLHAAGHEVVLVGGAVRDFLLGRAHGDWDLASAATPEEVMRLFPRTIPTGIEHGTVTVICGRGRDRVTTEITTFRGEGGYTDGRRPSEVRFLRALVDDLARRDFTVNAMAFNPLTKVFTDVFGGLEDLRAGVIRAVGEPSARLREDGLRAMRAVRLCATLGYRLDAATAAAISGALDILDRVSRERVQVEMTKLLGAPRPSRGLWPMLETGMWGHVLADYERGSIEAAIEAVDRLPANATLRLARLLWPMRAAPAGIEAVLDGRLRPSRDDRLRVLALTRARNEALLTVDDPARIRREVAALGRDLLSDALALLDADPPTRSRIEGACAGAALTAAEMAIGGRDLLAEKIVPPGPAMGRLLSALLVQVIEAPRRNEREALLAAARALVAEELTSGRGG